MRSEDLSYFEDEEFKGALHLYESTIKDGRQVYMDADDLTDIAEYYMVKERESDANKCINLAVSLHPDAIDPQVFLARKQLFHGNINNAKKIAEAINEQDDREVRFLWAEIYLKEGKRNEADQLLENYYNHLEEDRDLFLYDSAGVFMDYDEWELATKWAKKLKESFPKFNRTDILLSDIFVSCGKVAEAIPLLDDILNKDPFNLEAWNLMAEAQSGQEHYSEALEAIDYLLAIDEDNLQGQLIRANSLFHLNRMKEAHAQYQKYLEKENGDIMVIYFDAVALTNLERYDEALDQLNWAIEIAPDNTIELSHIFLQKSYILSKKHCMQEAIDALEDAYCAQGIEKDCEYYLLKGHILLENSDVHQAELCFSQSIQMSTDKFATYLTIAISWAENEYFTTAASIFDALLHSQMEQKESLCYPYLAYCLYNLNDLEKFRICLDKAVDNNPSLTEFLFSPLFPGIPVEKYKEIKLTK